MSRQKTIFQGGETFFDNKPKLGKSENGKDIYSIKDIEHITGIKAHTLRIWEQRYNFLAPKRTETNIRYFDEADLRLILNVSLLNNNGYKISKIAQMSHNEIQVRCNELVSQNPQDQDIELLIDAMLAFDEAEFTRNLSNHILRKGLEHTMANLVFPFLEKCGVLWITGRIQPAHEHFISNLIRQRLHVSIDNVSSVPHPQSKKFVLFVPSGENHDIGLLFANYLLKSRGHKVIYLGSSLPYEDLAQILAFHKPDYIFTIVTAMSSKINIQLFVDTLSEDWPEARILLTGSQILNKRDLEVPQNVTLLPSPQHFITLIDELNA